MSINVLLQVADSKNFTAGGGSASALAGAMAAGMTGMVARLSLGKDFGFTDSEYLEMAEELDDISEKLLLGAKEDTKAYLKIKDAYGLGKNTEEEKKVRGKAVSDAGIAAAGVPRDNGYLCKRVYELATSLEGRSNGAAGSDLASAVYLSAAGAKGCRLNIEANLSLIKEEDVVKTFLQDIKVLDIIK